MAKEIEERLSEALRKYPALYDKMSVDFGDKRKESLAWDDVAKETGLESKCYAQHYLMFFLSAFPYSNLIII